MRSSSPFTAPHGAADGKPYLIDFVPRLLALAGEHEIRLGVVGGAGSLHVTPDGPLLINLPEFPDEAELEAGSPAPVREAMRAAVTSADWFHAGADFAIAVDEIDTPAHHQTRFTVGY